MPDIDLDEPPPPVRRGRATARVWALLALALLAGYLPSARPPAPGCATTPDPAAIESASFVMIDVTTGRILPAADVPPPSATEPLPPSATNALPPAVTAALRARAAACRDAG